MFVMVQTSLIAQSIPDPLAHPRVVVNFSDKVVYAEVLPSGKKVNTNDHSYYYWFNSNDIKRTKGGYDGKLLHGQYTEFYLNKNLKVRGNFRYGLKNGNWKAWYYNGELSEVISYKKGKLSGKFFRYDEAGKLKQKGSFLNDQLHGKVYTYSGDTFSVLTYKKGEVVQEKEKKQRRRIIIFKKKSKNAKIEGQTTPKDNSNNSLSPGDESLPDSTITQPKKIKGGKKEKKKKGEEIKIKRIKKVVPAEIENKQT